MSQKFNQNPYILDIDEIEASYWAAVEEQGRTTFLIF